MVVEWFLGVVVGLMEGLLGALPVLDPPAWLTGAGGPVSTVIRGAGALSFWVPFDVAVPVAVTVVGVMLAGLAIKIVRIVLSLMTAGGGSAG